MRIFRFEFRRPQMLAAAMLLLFAMQCLWIVRRQVLTSRDYQYARCGRELWEKPSPLAGYLTSCGNISDGTFAYRAAGLPLTLERIIAGESAGTSTWEMRHLVWNVLLLLRLPFILFGVWLGGAIWWVARRLYGNEGGFLALALYCFCPAILRVAVTPNNEILAAWGLFGVIYTAIGLAHTMQGPVRRWPPRMALLALALGLTATAHAVAGLLGWLLAIGFMMYLAAGKRAQVLPVLAISSMGAFLVLLASYAFNFDALSYLFTSGDAFLKFSWANTRYALLLPENACIAIAGLASGMVYLLYRRSRYFGNTTPLLVLLLLFSLVTTGVWAEPWIWGLPFLFVFIGGVFADMLETRHRRAFVWLSGTIVAAQVALCFVHLRGLAG